MFDNSVKVLRDQHGLSLREVEDDYTKTTATHPSQGRGVRLNSLCFVVSKTGTSEGV